MDFELMGSLTGLSLKEKADKAVVAAIAAMRRHGPKKLAAAVTGGKDSTLMYFLLRRSARELGVPDPEAVFIDEGDVFGEIHEQLEQMRAQWGLRIVTLQNRDVIGAGRAVGEPVAVSGLNARNRAALAEIGFCGESFPFDPDSPIGCHLMKTVALREYLETSGKTLLACAIRWDEHPSRLGEAFESPRRNPDHVRLHPIPHFSERDVWDLTLAENIPFCSLYAKGYRSLGTRSGTVKNADVPAWEQDLERTPERAGRGAEKESAMEQLRALGYM